MSKFHIPASEADWPADSEERRQAGLAAAGALCNQEHIISDWGNFDGDYSDAEHDASLQSIGSGPSNRSDVHWSTIEDVEAFYDSCRAQEIRIKPHD